MATGVGRRIRYLVDTSAAKAESWVRLLSPQFKTDLDSDLLKDACPTGMPTNAGQVRDSPRACWTCGSKDHLQRDCPDRPSNAGQGDKSAKDCWSCGRTLGSTGDPSVVIIPGRGIGWSVHDR